MNRHKIDCWPLPLPNLVFRVPTLSDQLQSADIKSYSISEFLETDSLYSIWDMRDNSKTTTQLQQTKGNEQALVLGTGLNKVFR